MEDGEEKGMASIVSWLQMLSVSPIFLNCLKIFDQLNILEYLICETHVDKAILLRMGVSLIG